MGLLLIVEVMRIIDEDCIPAGIMGLTMFAGIPLIPIVGFQNKGILIGWLDRDERPHHRSLGRRIAQFRTTRTDIGLCKTICFCI